MSESTRFFPRQLELLGPADIEVALSEQSIIYIPLGAIEYHGLHLPIGLDGLTAHGMCLRAAEKTGGLVMPPFYFGMTGSIGHHPWTILVENEEEFTRILKTTLRRLEDFSVGLAVLFTGHFGRRQLAALKELHTQWSSEQHTMKLLTLSISECPSANMRGDHGAIFETSILAQMHPDLVHLERLPRQAHHPANDPDGNSWGAHRRDPENVLFGILGDDPRDYDEGQAEELFSTVLDWLVKSVIEKV